ncbi:MAG: tol-pal system protein YbgF [Alphaproteobacteria bacterium]
MTLFVAIGGASALAQSDWDMKNRVKRLENEIDTLSRAVYRGESPPPGAGGSGSAVGADVEIRLQQVENDMRELRGLLEQQSYENRQLKDQLERVTSDLELRLNDLEGAGASGVSGGGARYTAGNMTENVMPQVQPRSQAQSVGSAGGQTYQWSSSSGGDAESGPSGQLGSYSTGRAGASGTDLAAATYDNAFSLVKNRQYDRAQVELEAFLEAYPGHALAGNAKYWLGETYYVRGNFEKSARVFAEGYQQYPEGSKAADNLLKLGLSLEALGKRSDACIALQQLKKENPAGAAPVLRRADQEMSRLAC